MRRTGSDIYRIDEHIEEVPGPDGKEIQANLGHLYAASRTLFTTAAAVSPASYDYRPVRWTVISQRRPLAILSPWCPRWLDGRVARNEPNKRKARFGAEFDSLSRHVAFGVDGRRLVP